MGWLDVVEQALGHPQHLRLRVLPIEQVLLDNIQCREESRRRRLVAVDVLSRQDKREGGLGARCALGEPVRLRGIGDVEWRRICIRVSRRELGVGMRKGRSVDVGENNEFVVFREIV